MKSLTLKRFKSFVSEHVEFDNPTFFVGENGSGKSNLVDAIAFIAEAMAWPLANVIGRQGGIGLLMHKGAGGANPRQLGLGVSLAALDENVVAAHYGFVLQAGHAATEVVREQCVIDHADKTRYWFDRDARRYDSNVVGLAPAVSPGSLLLPIVGGDQRFAAVFGALSRMRVYRIDPSALRSPQAQNGAGGLSASGANAAAVLDHISRCSPDAAADIDEFLAVIAPGTIHVGAAEHAGKLELRFQQDWGANGRVTFEARGVSDGTLYALGLLTAVYQSPVPSLIAIEEPETTMHPGAIGAVIDLIRHAARRTQVVVTTHNPELLDAKWIEERHVRIVEWGEGRSRVSSLSEGSRQALAERLMGAGEMLRSNALSAPRKKPDVDVSLFKEVA